jgi:hypothetical protein
VKKIQYTLLERECTYTNNTQLTPTGKEMRTFLEIAGRTEHERWEEAMRFMHAHPHTFPLQITYLFPTARKDA